MLNCEGLLEFNLHAAVSYCVVIHSSLSFYIALVFLLVSAERPQDAYSHTEKHMRGQRMRHKIANREGRASSVKTLGMGQGVMYADQVVKIECLKVKFEVKIAFIIT